MNYNKVGRKKEINLVQSVVHFTGTLHLSLHGPSYQRVIHTIQEYTLRGEYQRAPSTFFYLISHITLSCPPFQFLYTTCTITCTITISISVVK